MSYTPHAIDPNTLSYLNVEHDGTVVTAAVWRALWGAVYNSLNAMNDFCVEINPIVDNWQEATEALLEAAQRLREELEAVQAGLVHYGDNPPENPDIKFWIKPTTTRWDLLEVLAAANRSADEAAASEYEAGLSANQATVSASQASTSASSSQNYANFSKSYAIGGTGVRSGEATDNAKYYSEQAATSASYSNHPPQISDDGYWKIWNGTAYVTTTDKAIGEDGEDGKSAYEYAVEGGYTGTEAQFYTDLAEIEDKYTLPSTGIPATDMADAVQTSLGKADSAAQPSYVDGKVAEEAGVARANETELAGQIDNLKNIGRFLAIWDASTGTATSNPPESPYTYRTGDYFRIGVVGNKIPTGATYTIGGTNYTTTTDTLAIGDVYYYDGTLWRRQAAGAGGTVQDVQLGGTSILNSGVANIPLNASAGIIYDGAYHALATNPANATEVLGQNTFNKPITPMTVVHATIAGLNPISLWQSLWTAERKSGARTTIGAAAASDVLSKTTFTCFMADGTIKTLTINGTLA